MKEKFSYSKLECFEGCGYKYLLQYVEKKTCYTGNIATEFGSAIHQAEEEIARDIIAKNPINYVAIKNKLILTFLDIEHKYLAEYNTPDDKSGRTYKEKAYKYLESEIYNLEKFMQANPTYEIVGVEQTFLFDYDETHTLRGAIDRVFHDKATDKYIIQDIKSWAVEKDKKDLATPLQFVIYVLAAKQLWNADPEQISCQYYLPLVNNGVTQDGGTPGFMTRGVKKLEKLFAEIQAEEFEPSPTPLCGWCNYSPFNPNAQEPYKYMCPYFMRYSKEHKDFSKENEWQGKDKHLSIVEAYHKKYNIKID